MKETPILKEIQIALSRGDVRLFRNNVGSAWRGQVSTLPDGSVLIRHPQLVHFGTPGSGDLQGWKSRVITPEMVGSRIAQFASVEVKSPTGHTKKELADLQANWRQIITDCGGIAGVARSVEEAKELLG